MAANTVRHFPLGELTALPKSLSWISGATSRLGKEGNGKEGRGYKGRKVTGVNTPNKCLLTALFTTDNARKIVKFEFSIYARDY